MAVKVARRRFTVDEYYKMAHAGILKEDDRVELIEGDIIEMAPIGAKHAACIRRLLHIFNSKICGKALVDAQNPLRIDKYSEPQPDLMLLKPREDFYATFHPRPEDVFLLVEVADTSVVYDREIKINLYARAEINEVWLIDLQARKITVYRQPSLNGYKEIKEYGRNNSIAPVAFPGMNISVREILPGD